MGPSSGVCCKMLLSHCVPSNFSYALLLALSWCYSLFLHVQSRISLNTKSFPLTHLHAFCSNSVPAHVPRTMYPKHDRPLVRSQAIAAGVVDDMAPPAAGGSGDAAAAGGLADSPHDSTNVPFLTRVHAQLLTSIPRTLSQALSPLMRKHTFSCPQHTHTHTPITLLRLSFKAGGPPVSGGRGEGWGDEAVWSHQTNSFFWSPGSFFCSLPFDAQVLMAPRC